MGKRRNTCRWPLIQALEWTPLEARKAIRLFVVGPVYGVNRPKHPASESEYNEICSNIQITLALQIPAA